MTSPAVKEHIEMLISLQEKDTALDQLNADAAAFRRQVEAQKELLEAEKNRLAVAHERGTQVALAKKAKELEVAEKEAAIAKHQKELNAVKSNEAFKALIHEIDRAKEEKDRIEDTLLQLMEEAEAVQRAQKEEQALTKKLEAETAVKIAEIEKQGAAGEVKIAAVGIEREQAAARLTPAILSKYESIRARRKGLAVVPALKDSCGGCHMQLPAYVQVEVRKGGALTACPNCTRILYVPVTKE
jgi:predicted  nucleic acid-binding Zn-ribbon protein